MQLYGAPTWSTLTASGLRSVDIPPQYTEVVIAADNDGNGAGMAAAETLRRRLHIERRKVRNLKPKAEGWDFNNVLQSRGGIAA